MTDAAAPFPPTQAAARARLGGFVQNAGLRYAQRRNHDPGPDGHSDVSGLSPYIRHRMITEAEVLREVLRHHEPRAAEKFIQEVIWRGYWKGWLEQRPGVWTSYRETLAAQHNAVQTQSGLRARWQAACLGDTGIAPFDAWARELSGRGYLHNHARMWFASIWIFTLELPWELGADFFMRHLLDGDPASNTCGWRWVAGLHTAGKTYRADAGNIAQFTGDRFTDVPGLATQAEPVTGVPNPDLGPLPPGDTFNPDLRTGLILHADDLDPTYLFDQGLIPVSVLSLNVPPHSPWMPAPHRTEWTDAAQRDALDRIAAKSDARTVKGRTANDISEWAAALDLDQIVTPYAPVGPVADVLAQTSAKRIRRSYDEMIWPHATHGFFRLKKHIPEFLDALDAVS